MCSRFTLRMHLTVKFNNPQDFRRYGIFFRLERIFINFSSVVFCNCCLCIHSEGLAFYVRLHDNVSKLLKRVAEVVATRSRERENSMRYEYANELSV